MGKVGIALDGFEEEHIIKSEVGMHSSSDESVG
jgi:hypothetical protein